MDRIIAYCGLTYSSCEAYLATKANDPAAIERVAAVWRARSRCAGYGCGVSRQSDA